MPILEIFGEYHSATGLRDRLQNAVFFWNLWAHVAKREDVGQVVRRLDDNIVQRMLETAHLPPDADLDRQVYRKAAGSDLIVYLMEQTLRIQHEAAKSLSALRLSTEGELPHLTRLPDAPRDFYLLRRPTQAGRTDYRKHRQLPRLLFPDMRVIPESIAGSLKVRLVTLPERSRKATASVRADPRTFGAAAVYEVATSDPGEGDIRFRLVALKAGADDRRREMIEGVRDLVSPGVDEDVALMWPELSVDQDVARSFLNEFQDRAPEKNPVGGARLVIPGTFSVEDSPRMVASPGGRLWPHTPNRAWIIDIDTGTKVFHQDKVRPVTPELHGRRYAEAIIETKVINIGVADWGVFCVMICRDFVDGDYPLIEQLDVDYVFVPSMGEQNTANAWREMAKRLARRWGGRSALAMQGAVGPDDWAHTPGAPDVATVY